MGITPITNLIPLQIARAVQADLEPLPMERVESTSRTGDETYSPSNGKSTRGSEDNADPEAEDEQFSQTDSGDQDDQPAYTHENLAAEPGKSRPISFFA